MVLLKPFSHFRELFNSKFILRNTYMCNCLYLSTFHLSSQTRILNESSNPRLSSPSRALRNIPGNEKNTFKSANERKKILKVAIIGVPNAGKSTLINQIMGRNIFATSKKVHTTRCNAKGVMVVQNTQIVFLDTPGLVNMQESIKHHLDTSCFMDSEYAVKEADVVGVIHDASNAYTQLQLDFKVLRLLLLYPKKHYFLILNKIDAMKSRRMLLDCVKHLTDGKGSLEKDELLNFDVTEDGRNCISESDIQAILQDQTGWPLFKDVFMVSALQGDAVGDIQFYLMNLAKPGEWLFTDSTTITDQSEVEIIEKTVFAKFLDHLPNVIPYNLKIQLEYFNKKDDGSITVVVLIKVKKDKIKKLIIGSGGKRIKNIAADIEQCLRRYFLNDVHIKLILEVEDHNSNEKLNVDITEIPPEGIFYQND